MQASKQTLGNYSIRLTCPACHHVSFITEKSLKPRRCWINCLMPLSHPCQNCSRDISIDEKNFPQGLKTQVMQCAEQAFEESEKVYQKVMQSTCNKKEAKRQSEVIYEKAIKQFSYLSEKDFLEQSHLKAN